MTTAKEITVELTQDGKPTRYINVPVEALPERLQPYVTRATTKLVRASHDAAAGLLTQVWERWLGGVLEHRFTLRFPETEL